MSKTYKKEIVITLDGDVLGRVELTLHKLLPSLKVRGAKDEVDDFVATIGSLVGLEEDQWKVFDLGISRRVPMRVLHHFFEGILFYCACRAGRFADVFFGYSGERILLRNLSSLPEFMVCYRFYLGLADDDGEFQVLNSRGESFTVEIQNPYDRLFSLGSRETVDKIKKKYGSPKVTVKGRKEMLAVNDSGRFLFGFGRCLSTIISKKKDPVRRFLEASYRYIRIPEYHAGRMSDNALFEVDEFVQSLRKVANYIFTRDLDWPYRKKERGPFTVPLFQVAGTRPIVKGKVLLSRELVEASPIVAPKYYHK